MRHVRGPVTLACSLMGTTEFLYFLVDEPELAARFSRVIGDVIIRMAEIMDEEAANIVLDYVDEYYSSDMGEEEYFSNVFSMAAGKIMETRP